MKIRTQIRTNVRQGYSRYSSIPAHVAQYIITHADVARVEQLPIEQINAWFFENWEGEAWDNPTNYSH